jgi:hypothetical protein
MPVSSLAGDMEHQAIELVLQIAEREGFTPSELLADALDRCMKVNDTCFHEKESQHKRQPPVERSGGEVLVVSE